MKKALIFYGGWDGHDPAGLAHLFAEMLQAESFDVTLSDTLDVLQGDLAPYDLIIPIWTMGTLDAAAEANVCRAVAAGCGIAGCHGGMCDAFRWSTDWQFMTGSQWVAHPGNGDVTYTVRMKRASDSPIIRGISDFSVTSEQYYIHVDPAVNVLASTQFPVVPCENAANGAVEMPVVYTKLWGNGRVFYNSLGHDHTIFDIPEARELMRRGFVWAARGAETEVRK